VIETGTHAKFKSNHSITQTVFYYKCIPLYHSMKTKAAHAITYSNGGQSVVRGNSIFRWSGTSGCCCICTTRCCMCTHQTAALMYEI